MKLLFTSLLLTWFLNSAHSQITIVKEEQHLAIIKANQKIFLERGDYMKDEIFKITDKDDTVSVIEADKTYFRFKKDTLMAWSLVAQLDQEKGILTKPNLFEIELPFKQFMRSDSYAYDEASKIANKILDLKKGEQISVENRINGFFEIKYKGRTAFVFENDILPYQSLHPIRKAQTEVTNVMTRTYYRGSKGGCYYLSSSGEKVYVDRSFCK